jgi:hypothetical protein
VALGVELAPWGSGILILNRVADGDEFIGNLWKIHCRVKEEGYVQVTCLDDGSDSMASF